MEVITIARAFGWFRDHNAVFDCVFAAHNQAKVSVLMPEIHSPNEGQLIVLGPLSHDFACYPFLDIWRHIRRLGIEQGLARRYADIFSKGAVIVCVEDCVTNPLTWLRPYPVHDVALVP